MIKIFVLDRGHVIIGKIDNDAGQYALWLPIKNARIIRRWGTTTGLSQLCNGPLSNTLLDAMAPFEEIPVRAIIRVISLTEQGEKLWSEVL